MFGFHLGPGGNATGHKEFLETLDAAGIPFVCKSADAFPIDAQRIAQQSGLRHTVIYRRSLDDAADPCPSSNPDVPDYSKDPQTAALEHWDWHIRHLPPEFDPAVTWLETINEVDKNRSEWLAEFAYHTAVLAIGDGYKWAAFGWSVGEPEPGHWHGAKMQAFLEVCAQFSDRIAIAVHEYSLDVGNVWNGRDANGRHWLVGRVEHLFAACDSMNIPHPTVLITEWGWTHDDVPGTAVAEQDYVEVAQLYAQYPTIRGAATWYLGGGWNGIAQKAQQLVAPLQALFLSGQIPTVPTEPPPPSPSPCPGEPREQYKRTYWVAPQDVDEATWLELARQAFAERRTIGFSYDDAGIGALDDKTAVLYGIDPAQRGVFGDWYWRHYPNTRVEFRDLPGTAAPRYRYRPCDTDWVTQWFGENPQNYPLTPGHEGIDFGVAQGHPFYAVQDGTVVHASDRRWTSNTPSDYGWHVVIQHDDGTATVYAHAAKPLPVAAGDVVKAGEIVGYSGNTGNSTGYHLHFTTLDQTGTIDPNNGYPTWKYGRPVDPWPWISGLLPPPSPPSPPSPPPAGPARIGLHASADPGDLYGGNAEFAEFATLRPGVVKVLSAHSAASIARLTGDVPADAHWIVRAFLDFGGRNIAPQQFFNDTQSDVRRAVSTLQAAGVPDGHIHVELHNESNLVQEGWTTSWANGRAFGDWLLSVAALYRGAFPTVRLMYPGLSPGSDVPGVRADSARFLTDSQHALIGCDSLGIHAYWSQGYPMAQALVHVDAHAAYGKLAWVTEASRNDRPAVVPAAQYGNEYRLFWQEMQKRPWVQGVTYFVASASNPYFHPECWVVNGVGRGIAAAIRS